jgi:uncharacterized protein (DUF305 family)
MPKLYPSVAAFALALAATSAAPVLAQGTSGGATQHAMPMAGQDKAGVPTGTGGKVPQGADAEFHHGMAMMQHEMGNMKMTGDADQDFVAMMIPHHRGAVDMAKVELKYGNDPELKKLAQDIVKAQDDEIKFMQNWQAKHPK